MLAQPRCKRERAFMPFISAIGASENSPVRKGRVETPSGVQSPVGAALSFANAAMELAQHLAQYGEMNFSFVCTLPVLPTFTWAFCVFL
jgi:hypothetical protein